MADLSLRHIGKRYRQTVALADVSLDVADGEFLVMLGPSGSGKSTVLKLIAGIEVPDEGEIWLGGRRIESLLPRFRDVAMVFQSYALYPHMTVAKNLSFPLESTRLPRTERKQRIEEVARMLSLEDLLARKPSQLSGGQQQRVALGRAVVRRPKLFLLDEPLSNLDAQLRTRTRLELVALHDRLGATTVYVTHDQTEAMTMGHRVAVIDGGRLHQVGTPEAVYEYPANLVVARFLGSPPMNLLNVDVEPRATELCLRGNGFTFQASGPELNAAKFGTGRPMILGLRPEYLIPDSPLNGPRIQGVLSRVELLGHERLAYLRVGDATVAAWAPRSWRGQVGETIPLGIDVNGIRLFDPQSEHALAAPS